MFASRTKATMAFQALLLMVTAGCGVSSTQSQSPGAAARATLSTITPLAAATAAGANLVPSPGDLLTEWKGIPIMPGAAWGRVEGNAYVFAVRVGPSEIAEYYTVQMSSRGYELIPGNALSDDGRFYALRFSGDGELLVVTIMPRDDAVEVKLAK